MNLELSDDAHRVRPPGAAGLRGRRRRPAGAAGRGRARRPGSARGTGARRARRLGPRPARRPRRAGGRRRAVPQRRVLGAAVPGRRAPGPPGRPRRRRAYRGRRAAAPAARGRRSGQPVGRSHPRRPAQHGRRPRAAGRTPPSRSAFDRLDRGRRRRRRRCRPRPGAAVLDPARHARPGHGADHRPRASCASSSASRCRRSRVCSSSSPTPRSNAAASRCWPSTRCGASRRAADALDDALALRLAAIEAAEVVLPGRATSCTAPSGFCDETTLSWLSRYSQPLRRLPFGLSATRQQLTQRLGRRGLTGLFS